MKISELAAYRETLESLKLTQSETVLTGEMDAAIYFVKNNSIAESITASALEISRKCAIDAVQDFNDHVDKILAGLLQEIQTLEPAYLSRSYHLYHAASMHDSVDTILNRRLSMDAAMQSHIQSRVQAHSDYHHAGMIIRPGLEHWIEHMVACDPLYIVDTSHDLFRPVKEKFNDQYQARLRYYAIRESSERPMLAALPNNQFGFVLAYNFFHYKPFEIMRAYLQEIYQKLRPGGILGITFNDCDRQGAVRLAEQMANCYTPGRLVIAACESAGFVIEQNDRIDAAVNWVEMRKPGHMASLRGGQTLAKIVAKSK